MGLYGAIIGDIIGSRFEFFRPKGIDFNTVKLLDNDCEFTDDTVLLIATKYAMEKKIPFDKAYAKFSKMYPNRGYGGKFLSWIYADNKKPYNSYGNGSAMRVAYVADICDTKEEVIRLARETAIVTHNHPEGIKGAIVTAVASFMARTGSSKDDIKKYAIEEYGNYYFDKSLDTLRKEYYWNEICQDSVPLAIRCFLESESYEDFIRKVFSFDCDMDTICAIGGGIAENYYDGCHLGISEIVVLKKYLDTYLFIKATE